MTLGYMVLRLGKLWVIHGTILNRPFESMYVIVVLRSVLTSQAVYLLNLVRGLQNSIVKASI